MEVQIDPQPRIETLHERHRARPEFAAKCRTEAANIVWVSAPENRCIAQLRELVRPWLA